MKNFSKIVFLIFYFHSFNIFTQTNSQIKQAKSIIKKKGLSESQVKNIAKWANKSTMNQTIHPLQDVRYRKQLLAFFLINIQFCYYKLYASKSSLVVELALIPIHKDISGSN